MQGDNRPRRSLQNVHCESTESTKNECDGGTLATTSCPREYTLLLSSMSPQRKWSALFALCLVLLALPLSTYEFGFGAVAASSPSNVDHPMPASGAGLFKKATLLRKYKFHKIERLIEEEDNDNEDDDDDDDVDSDNDNKDSEEDEKMPFRFKRVRKSDSNERIHHRRSGRREVKEDQMENISLEKSFIQSLLEKIWGDGDRDDEPPPSKSNSIIEWLQSLVRSSDTPVKEENQNSEENGWLSYLNRWPFNSIFRIGQPEKPIGMPRHSRAAPSHRKNGVIDDSDEDGDDNRDDNNAAELSQAHFESLLRTLPSFIVSATHVSGKEAEKCRQQLQVFQRQMRAHKLWTLQMLDATAKLPSGLLRGHINQFGDFEQCMRIRTLIKVTPNSAMRMRGKYCLAHIETGTHEPGLKLPVHLAHGRSLWNSHLGNPSHFVPRYGVANWGVCVPHQCPASVVQQMLEASLQPYNHTTGMELHVEVNEENDCYVLPSGSGNFYKLLRTDVKFTSVTCCFVVLILLVILAALLESWSPIKAFFNGSQKDSSATETVDDSNFDTLTDTAKALHVGTSALSIKQLFIEIIKSFSPRRTANELLSTNRNDVEFPILHLLKLIATLMLYVCLKFIMIGHLPITDRDRLVHTVDQRLSVVFRTPLIYADILLLVSGFLVAYPMANEMAERTYIHLLKRVASKVARTLPTVYVVLLFHTWVLPHLGAGPLWTNLVGQNARICEEHLWRNLFSVQNVIDFEETCSPMTIQLALEMQLFLLAPLIVWLFDVDSDAGFFACGLLQASSVGMRFAQTNAEQLSTTHFHGMNVSKFYRTANLMYASPLARATPYLLGISAALLHRSQGAQIWPSAPTASRCLGWFTCFLTIFWCFWFPSSGMRSDFVYSSKDAAVYASWSPLLLGLALCWLILMFPASLQSDQSVIGMVLGSRPVLFLSRITFPVQLVAFVLVLYHTALATEAVKFEYNDLINFTEIGLIILTATILAFIIDVPAKRIRNLLIDRIFAEKATADIEPESEATSAGEPSEGIAADAELDTVPPSVMRIDDTIDSNEMNVPCDTPEPSDSIWASDAEEEEIKYITRRRSSTQLIAAPVENGEINENTDAAQNKQTMSDDSEDIEEIEEEEDEEDITEEDEVMKRPETPPPADTYSRRRRRPSNEE